MGFLFVILGIWAVAMVAWFMVSKYFKASASRAAIENGHGRHDYAEADSRNDPEPTGGRFISALTACGTSMMIADVGPIWPIGPFGQNIRELGFL